MPYDVTTIGSLLGSCSKCGDDRRIDLQRISGVADMAAGVADRLNPFSDDFFLREIARRAAQTIEEKIDAAQDAVRKVDPARAQANAVATALDIVGVPTWGYSANLITGIAIVGVLAVGGVLVVSKVKKKKGRKR